MKRVLNVFLFFCFLLNMSRAFADYSAAAAKCISQKNIELVRFGNTSPGEPIIFFPLPSAIKKEFERIPYEKVDDCILANGERLDVMFSESAILLKENGADPNIYISVTLNKKMVYIKTKIYEGYGSSKLIYSGLILNNKKITLISSNTILR